VHSFAVEQRDTCERGGVRTAMWAWNYVASLVHDDTQWSLTILTLHARVDVLGCWLAIIWGPHVRSAVRKVLVVDDHPIVREGITLLLTGQHDLEVCGSAVDVASALAAVRELKPDVALIDLSLGTGSGLDLIAMLSENTQNDVSTLALSMHDEALYAKRVLQAGGSGYVMKHEGTDVLLQAIRTVLAGEIYVSAAVNASLLRSLTSTGRPSSKPPAAPIDSMSDLSNRELQIYRLVGQGVSTREIARQLCLSVKTVESHRANIKQKLGVDTAAALVAHAAEWHVRSGSSDRFVPPRLDDDAVSQAEERRRNG
jgi:DNA-binding NarL/FixJ family response regulator